MNARELEYLLAAVFGLLFFVLVAVLLILLRPM